MRKRKYTSLSSAANESFTTQIDSWTANVTGDSNDFVHAMPRPVVHNLVGTCVMKSSSLPLNLKQISYILPNAHYDKQKFAAITLRLAMPACTVLLFTSGKMVLTGSKTYLDCKLAAKLVCIMLRRAFPGMRFSLAQINIQNIVGNVNLNLTPSQEIDLMAINRDYDIVCTYQKNMFPGLILRPIKSRIVFLIFTSGKIVLTGAKCTTDLAEEWNLFAEILMQYVR